MNLGTLLSSAGQVSAGMREAEEAERIARLNQLKVEQQNRIARELTRAQEEAIQPSAGLGLQLPEMPVTRQIAPAAPAGTREPVVLPGKPAAAPEKLTYESVEAMLPPGDQRRGGSYRARRARQQEEADINTRIRSAGLMAGVVESPPPFTLRSGTDTPDTLTAQDMAAIPTTQLTREQWRNLPVGEKVRRMRELEATRGTAAAPAAAPPSLIDAMVRVESAGRPSAVSEKGAVGLMQVLPSTAMDPGFGLPNIFDFAQQRGVQVSARTEAEAKRLLTDPQIGRAYGEQYMNAMLAKYNGDVQTALVAYNAGPSFADQWLNEGADPNRLPTETRNYIPKVLGLLTGTTVATAEPVAAAATPAAAPARAAEEQPRRNVYLENPQMIPVAMQQTLQQRNEIARMANIYLRMGTMDGLARFEQYRGLINQADNSMMYLQGMQGLQEFSLAGDPRRLSAVWSHYAGANVAIQPRSDGNYDLLVDGQTTREGLTFREVSAGAQKSFDEAARRADQEFAATVALERLKSGLKREEAGFTALAEIEKAIVEGEYKLAEQRLKEVGINNVYFDSNTGAAIIVENLGNGRSEARILDLEDLRKMVPGPLGTQIPAPLEARTIGLQVGR